MNRTIIRMETALVMTSVFITSLSCSSNDQAADGSPASNAVTASNPIPPGAPVPEIRLNAQELDEILAPIALYPDPILAQMLPAATFVDQLTEAQRTLNGRSDDSLIANQDWDVSVKSVAHYPPVLKTMTDDLDWTTTLGQAFISQPEDINGSIQRLRFQASDTGNLVTTPQMAVIEKDNIIRLEPAQPEVIYVPQYNSETVYVEQAPVYEEESGISTGEAVAIGALAFTAGLAIGSWLNRDYDYYGYYGPPGPYYHGWSGTGWVGVNRGYVDVNRSVYVNNSYRNINVNRGVYNRNVTNYRSNVTQRSVVRDQRATNARVNRQLDRNPGGGPGGTRDLNNGRGPLNGRDPGGIAGDRGLDRNVGGREGDRRDPGAGRGQAPRRDVVGGQQPGMRGNDRNDMSRSRGGDRQAPNRPQAQPQRQNAAPRQQQQRQNSAPRQQPQRSAPSGGSGGRRRG